MCVTGRYILTPDCMSLFDPTALDAYERFILVMKHLIKYFCPTFKLIGVNNLFRFWAIILFSL